MYLFRCDPLFEFCKSHMRPRINIGTHLFLLSSARVCACVCVPYCSWSAFGIHQYNYQCLPAVLFWNKVRFQVENKSSPNCQRFNSSGNYWYWILWKQNAKWTGWYKSCFYFPTDIIWHSCPIAHANSITSF